MIFIYIVCANQKEAQKIGQACVRKHLAACANFFPIGSFYWWKKKLVKDREYALLLKTKKESFSKVKTLVKTLHSYEVPCICSWKMEQVEKNYWEWLKNEAR